MGQLEKIIRENVQIRAILIDLIDGIERLGDETETRLRAVNDERKGSGQEPNRNVSADKGKAGRI